jgi:predicted dehydrogenase
MRKIKIGVLGGGRGSSMINYCKKADNAELVAICDKLPEVIEHQKSIAKEQGYENITYYYDFDEFLKHDMDAVVLANYAHEHTPFAIKCMRAGKHVFSEVLPAQTMKEAVELIETVEETKMIYAYGENYCFMAAPFEMKKQYKSNRIGELEYAECEYIHNCESIWPSITYGEADHWRNKMYSTFYCTHSIGPIIHATGLRPVKVSGFEGANFERQYRTGAQSANFGIEMITLENGAIIKSIHGNLYKDSIWYCMYGSKGRMESAREDSENGKFRRIYINADEFSGEYAERAVETYEPFKKDEGKLEAYGHGGSDYISMYNFIEKILGNKDADTIDVYEAMDMFLPGLFAYRSILADGAPMEIPNLRDKNERKKWKNDTACTDAAVAGDMLLPPSKNGWADIPKEVFERQKQLFEEDKTSTTGYHYQAAHPGSKNKNGLLV